MTSRFQEQKAATSSSWGILGNSPIISVPDPSFSVLSRILGPMQNKCPVFYVSGPTFRVPDLGSQNSSMSCVWGLCPTSRVSGARSRVSPTRWVPGLTSQVSPKVAGLGYHFLDMLGETCLTPAIGWKPEKCFQKQKFKI